MVQPPYSVDQLVNYLRAVNRADRREYDKKPLTSAALVDILYEARHLYHERTNSEPFTTYDGIDLAKYQQWLFEDAALGVNDTLGGTDERNEAIRNDYNTVNAYGSFIADCLNDAYHEYMDND